MSVPQTELEKFWHDTEDNRITQQNLTELATHLQLNLNRRLTDQELNIIKLLSNNSTLLDMLREITNARKCS